MKILIVSDAWEQTNGVVTTLLNLIPELEKQGHHVRVFSHKNCERKFTLPFYKEITIGIPSNQEIKKAFEWQPNIVHIVTLESPMGLFFANYCEKRDIPFTASYHTNFPEYLKKMAFIPKFITYHMLKNLYSKARRVLTPSNSCTEKLRGMGFRNVYTWARGVDRSVFWSDNRGRRTHSRNIICVSRISKEKNLETFFEMARFFPEDNLIMIGDGPKLAEYKAKYKDINFVGKMTGKTLGDIYRDGDVFVFPSMTDTFGLVMIEANACGVPVVAFNVEGPRDIIKHGVNGYLVKPTNSRKKNADYLAAAVEIILDGCNSERIVKESEKWTWEECARIFLHNSYRI